jgi:hypothetical protein
VTCIRNKFHENPSNVLKVISADRHSLPKLYPKPSAKTERVLALKGEVGGHRNRGPDWYGPQARNLLQLGRRTINSSWCFRAPRPWLNKALNQYNTSCTKLNKNNCNYNPLYVFRFMELPQSKLGFASFLNKEENISWDYITKRAITNV